MQINFKMKEDNEMDIKVYKKDAEYSYTLGAFPTIELLKTRPKDVLEVYVHSTFTGDKSSITGEADKIYYQIKDNYDGLYDEEYILEGLYLDAAFTKKVTENTQISNNADIFALVDIILKKD